MTTVVFAIASRGKNEQEAVPQAEAVPRIARGFNPMISGDARHGVRCSRVPFDESVRSLVSRDPPDSMPADRGLAGCPAAAALFGAIARLPRLRLCGQSKRISV